MLPALSVRKRRGKKGMLLEQAYMLVAVEPHRNQEAVYTAAAEISKKQKSGSLSSVAGPLKLRVIARSTQANLFSVTSTRPKQLLVDSCVHA